jgi:hypothetical protein
MTGITGPHRGVPAGVAAIGLDWTGPLQPETFESIDATKQRVRQLIAQHGSRASIEIWNEDERWQVISSAVLAS